MPELPEGLEKFLKSLGVNTSRLKWKLYDLSRWWERFRAKFKPVPGKKRYKHCRCGQLHLAEDKVCVSCGKKLPSYIAYRIKRLLAIEVPSGGIVSPVFLFVIVLLYALQVAKFGFSSLMLPSGEALVRFGALTGNLVREGEYFRILTMALVHIGVIHILFNSMAISQMLPHFEEEIGSWATLIVITATQLAAAGAHLVFYNPLVVTAGASGIGFGLIGFGVAYFRRKRRRAESRFFFQWFIYGMAFSFIFRANHAAHVGGFAAGLVLGYILAVRAPGPVSRKIRKAAGILCLLAWAASIALMF